MNAVVNKNTVSPLASSIAAIMNDAASSENKQAALVVAMFDNEVSFGNDILIQMLRKEKKERTMARENLLRSISDDYATALDTIKVIKDKGKEKTEKEAFQSETLNKKVRAANIMFDRAAITVWGLREQKAKSVKTSSIGAGALIIKTPDEDGDYINHKLSCATALSGATKVLDKALGKKKEPANAPNPAKAGMTQTIDAVSTFLDVAMRQEETPVHSIADFADATEASLETLFAKLFYLKFGAGNDASVKDIKAYATELAKIAITPAVGNNNGKSEEKKSA